MVAKFLSPFWFRFQIIYEFIQTVVSTRKNFFVLRNFEILDIFGYLLWGKFRLRRWETDRRKWEFSHDDVP